MSRNTFFLRKGIIFFLFFSFNLLYSQTIISDSLKKDISKSHKWKALLHVRDNKANINNETFLLSFNDFSLSNELMETIKNFDEGKFICKYPARYLFLKNKIKNNSFKEFNCPRLNNYIFQTNPKDLDLIFTAENVSSPSSMMGHIFFKLNSKKKNGSVKTNAVSFFTLIDTYNFPLLITRSTITGMKGYFILNPYKTQAYRYLYEENRSIWEYKLNLNEEDKKLILYHFWELKDIDIKYLFTGFNCATMVDDILSLTNKNYMKNALWITPKDVIKNAKRNKLISSVKMIPSIQWELSMLEENIENKKLELLLDILNKKDFKELKNFKYSIDEKQEKLEKHFILTYAKYMYLNKDTLSIDEYLKIKNMIKEKKQYLIDIKDYKNPLNTYDDSQVNMYYGKTKNEKFVGFSFLAASNTIYDDNREYFSENSLEIGKIDFRINSEKLYLNSLDIYNMKLLIPWSNITKTLSKEFKLNYEKQKKEDFSDINVLNISGALGLTNKLHNDVYFYNLLKLGSGINFKNPFVYSSFETGLIVYELFDMKTVLSHEFIYNQDNSDNTYNNIILNQSIFFDKKDWKLDLYYNRKINDNLNEETFTFNIKYFF